MKKTVKLNENDLLKIVNKLLKENKDDKSYMSLDTLRKSAMTMLDWGWTVEDLHKLIDHIAEIYEINKSNK